MVTEPLDIIKQKTENSNINHLTYEICDNQLMKGYSKGTTTGFSYSDENARVQHQRQFNLASDADRSTNIPNEHSVTDKYDTVNTSDRKFTGPEKTEICRKHKSSNQLTVEKSIGLFYNQQACLSKYHHTPKTNKQSHKSNYPITNIYPTDNNYTNSSDVTHHLKFSQYPNSSTDNDNNVCHITTDSLIHNENVLDTLNNDNTSRMKNHIFTSSSSSSSNCILSRSPYKCRKCKGHGMFEPVRQHKRNCPYRDCSCDMCYLVEKGRRIVAQQIALFRDQKNHNSQKISYQKDRSLKSITMKESMNKIDEDNGPHCRRCRNHGQNIPWKGHKKTCPYKECYCNQCILISLRKSNEKDLREVTQEFIESQPDKGEKKAFIIDTTENYEMNTSNFTTNYPINSNLNSITTEEYKSNTTCNSYSHNFPISSYPSLMNRTSVNSLIRHLVTSSHSNTTSNGLCTTQISQDEISSNLIVNKPTYSTCIPSYFKVENPNLQSAFCFLENTSNLSREYNEVNIDSLNLKQNEINSQKVFNTDSRFIDSHSRLSSPSYPTSLIPSTISLNKFHRSDYNVSQLSDFYLTHEYYDSKVGSMSSMKPKYETIINPNISLKSNYLDRTEDYNTYDTSLPLLHEPSTLSLETRSDEDRITECFLNTSSSRNTFQNFIDYVNPSNDHLNCSNQQFKTNSSCSSQVNKAYSNSNFCQLQEYQGAIPNSLISSSTFKNTIIQQSDGINKTYSSDYLAPSININEDEIVRPTANHAAALAAAAAAAVAFHHEVTQQKHQKKYYQQIEATQSAYEQSNTRIQRLNSLNNSVTTTTHEQFNVIHEPVDTSLHFLNMSNILNDNSERQNYPNDHLFITSPLLQSIKSGYTKSFKTCTHSIEGIDVNKFPNNLVNTNYDSIPNVFTNYPWNSERQQYCQQYSINDTFNRHEHTPTTTTTTTTTTTSSSCSSIITDHVNQKQLSTIKHDTTDFIHHEHQEQCNNNNTVNSIQYNSSVKINQEINKLQIIHLTNAIILPPKQSLSKIQDDDDNRKASWSSFYPHVQQQQQQHQQQQHHHHQHQQQNNKNNTETWNLLPNECNNLWKNFEVSTNVFKQIGL
ncbi:Doublesex- and mab-3-related transcription factor 3a [Schistosoma japonicum]|uniref:Doublesex-and mab-3-related transcription factor 3a n=1 Tax=Schistosoma japonicum TaxID=6182 RepID=A0A4Z2DAW9_SCHJA|nr:Doublesex- and mab-3-related transcription factor 3a [Schistosoma japonicum]